MKKACRVTEWKPNIIYMTICIKLYDLYCMFEKMLMSILLVSLLVVSCY